MRAVNFNSPKPHVLQFAGMAFVASKSFKKTYAGGLGHDMDVECVNYTFGGIEGFPRIRAQVIPTEDPPGPYACNVCGGGGVQGLRLQCLGFRTFSLLIP